MSNKGISARFRDSIRNGTKRPGRYPCRCTACGRRHSLARAPDNYIRPPRCCRLRDEQGRFIAWARLRVDWYRMAREWNNRNATCYWCGAYSFPHAKGRGYCYHNKRLTAEQLQEREESGRWA